MVDELTELHGPVWSVGNRHGRRDDPSVAVAAPGHLPDAGAPHHGDEVALLDRAPPLTIRFPPTHEPIGTRRADTGTDADLQCRHVRRETAVAVLPNGWPVRSVARNWRARIQDRESRNAYNPRSLRPTAQASDPAVFGVVASWLTRGLVSRPLRVTGKHRAARVGSRQESRARAGGRCRLGVAASSVSVMTSHRRARFPPE